MMKRTDLDIVIENFKLKSKPEDRYTSFDYCYNYFRSTKNLNEDIEKSCLVLGFYLASWGMFRGSSFLLQHSIKHFQSAIEYISTRDKSDWEIDVDTYNEKNIETIINIYHEIKKRLIPDGNTDLTLITKVLLGVFGFIPAFDNYFCDSFRTISDNKCGFRRVNKTSLGFIHTFYLENKLAIDNLASQTFTTDFLTGKQTKTNYTKAKIIDMYGFNYGKFIQTEKVFEILGEGGGICISRQKNELGEKFIYHHKEFDPSDEGLDVNIKDVYDNFEQPFQLINNQYPWYILHLSVVHNEFRNYIIEMLIEKLNDKPALIENFEYHKEDLEHSLNIKLNCSINQQTNNLTWTCEKL
jgi:hypothetical protein